MFKDWLYYPLMALVFACIVYIALSFRVNVDTAKGTEFFLQGEDLSTLFAADGTESEVISSGSQGSPYALMVAHEARNDAASTPGVFTTLGPMFEKMFAGQNLRISVHARKGASAPTDTFEIAYFTEGVGDSPWYKFDVTKEFQTYSFNFKPALPNADPANDYVGIWPDASGDSGTLEVKWIKVEVLTEPNLEQRIAETPD